MMLLLKLLLMMMMMMLMVTGGNVLVEATTTDTASAVGFVFHPSQQQEQRRRRRRRRRPWSHNSHSQHHHHHHHLLLLYPSGIGTPLQMSENSHDDENIAVPPITAMTTTTSSQASLERTRAHLAKLQQQRQQAPPVPLLLLQEEEEDNPSPLTRRRLDPMGMERERIYVSHVQRPAMALKYELQQRQLPDHGRKPELAQRLTQDDLLTIYGDYMDHGKLEEEDNDSIDTDRNGMDNMLEYENGTTSARVRRTPTTTTTTTTTVTTFAGLFPLSSAASAALTLSQFQQPSHIQARAIPFLSQMPQQSAILHAATGSGKTLAYLLPFTERLWDNDTPNKNNSKNSPEDLAIILTPTRELAAQVAGIATILSPPGTVRLVTRPSNLMSRLRPERITDATAHLYPPSSIDQDDRPPRIYVGSAKAIYQSLYGDGKMPASPTSKPEAMYILKHTRYLVLDEVDRLLGVVGGSTSNLYGPGPRIQKKNRKSKSLQQQPSTNDGTTAGRTNNNHHHKIIHEQPAAILTAAVARLTLGQAMTVAASATVGRPLRRELARCMGLTPKECPMIIRDTVANDDEEDDDIRTTATSEQHSNSRNDNGTTDTMKVTTTTTTRAVTIPKTVRHYVIPVHDGTSPGKILTTAYTAIQSLGVHRRMLLVLTRNFGINTQNAIGALKHFNCHPEPISLLDALETTDGTEAMMQLHRQVTGVRGVGGSLPVISLTEPHQPPPHERGYLLVTGEDTVRGLHLDGLDVVLVASRSVGPDEYTHIAGRTGRAGKLGSVINIVSDVDVQKVTAWENMLDIKFVSCADPKLIGQILDDVNDE
jgi:DEAD/DEAH box helicase